MARKTKKMRTRKVRKTRKKRGGDKSKKIKKLTKIFQQYPKIFPSGYFRFLAARLENHINKNTGSYPGLYTDGACFLTTQKVLQDQ